VDAELVAAGVGLIRSVAVCCSGLLFVSGGVAAGVAALAGDAGWTGTTAAGMGTGMEVGIGAATGGMVQGAADQSQKGVGKGAAGTGAAIGIGTTQIG
jgi:hypothetical protein